MYICLKTKTCVYIYICVCVVCVDVYILLYTNIKNVCGSKFKARKKTHISIMYKWRIQNFHPYPVADHLALRELRELRGRSCAGLAGPTSTRGEAILGVEAFSITISDWSSDNSLFHLFYYLLGMTISYPHEDYYWHLMINPYSSLP